MESQVLLLQTKLPLPGKVELTQWAGLRTHFCRRIPMKSCRPIRAKTLRQKTVRIITSASFLTDWMRALTMVFKPEEKQTQIVKLFGVSSAWWKYSGQRDWARPSPGITDIVFRARRTLNVRNAETFPRSTNSVTYLGREKHKSFSKKSSALWNSAKVCALIFVHAKPWSFWLSPQKCDLYT